MIHTDYVTGTPADREEIVDFSNYVFSQAHRPHDFKTLLPKTYADNAQGIEAWHFLAKQNSRIRALIAARPTKMFVLDRQLMVGCVGTVSVHPYSRGEGHMKKLMQMMIEDCRARNYDLLMLGGQRQRYGYFGFEHGGLTFAFDISDASARHGLKDVDASGITFSEITDNASEEADFAWALSQTQAVRGDRPRGEFLDIMHSWTQKLTLIRIDGDMAGYLVGEVSELVLKDEGNFPRVIKALFEARGLRNIHIAVAPHETARLAQLKSFFEERIICKAEMLNVLNWRNVLDALLTLKAGFTTLQDGDISLCIDNQNVRVRVENGVPSVETCEKGEIELEHMDAQRLLFGLEQLLSPDPRFKNWAPLPFSVSNVDSF